MNPTGAFTVSSPYTWDLSNLYTTGEVTLSNVPGLFVLGDFNRDGQLTATDIPAMLTALTDLRSYETAKGLSDAALVLLGDVNGDHAVDNSDIQGLLDLVAGQGSASPATSVPEPSTCILLLVGAIASFSIVRASRRRARPLPSSRSSAVTQRVMIQNAIAMSIRSTTSSKTRYGFAANIHGRFPSLYLAS